MYEDEMIIVPIVIPNVEEVKAFAAKLHAEGLGWKGELFGWQAEYTPERSEAPLDSNMTLSGTSTGWLKTMQG